MILSEETPAFVVKPEEVHVWLFDLEGASIDFLGWEGLLSQDEIDRSRRFKFEQDRQRFIARRGILRQLLGRYCGVAPARINYIFNPDGKLSMPGELLHFNISRCQSRIVFGLTQNSEIGIDIEQVIPIPGFEHMMEFYFSLEECNTISSLPPAVQLDAFYQVWTQKEAVLKALGQGLNSPTRDFSVPVNSAVPGKWISIKGFEMISFLPDPGWRAALCVNLMKRPDIIQYRPALADFLKWVSL